MTFRPLVVDFRGQQVEIEYHHEMPPSLPRWFDDVPLVWDFNEVGMENVSLNVTPAEDKAIREACEEHAFDQYCMRE